MFEQEAEEYTMKKICKNCTYRCYTENILKSNKLDCFSYARGYKIFKDGAEFGYNKAKEDADKMKSRFLELCNLKDMRIAELEKANEWHEIESKVSPKREISKQYMPKNKEKVLLKYHFSGDDEIHISDGYYDAYNSEFLIANNPKFRIICVIAWRELPKKENE